MEFCLWLVNIQPRPVDFVTEMKSNLFNVLL